MAQGSANHFSRAACPTFVEARVLDQDRQIVAAPVMARLRTRRTTPHVVPPRSSHLSYVIQNPESRTYPLSRSTCLTSFHGYESLLNLYARNESPQFLFGQ